MRIADVYKRKKPELSFEIFPPKRDTALSDITETLDVLCELEPDYISVTFGAGGTSNNNKTIQIARLIKDKYGIEPLVHLTCRCYSKTEIDGFVKELKANGIENVLALRGDDNPAAPPKSDFLHASDLTAYLKANTDFCIGGACYPDCHPESFGRVDEMEHLKMKVDAGADFLVSQLFYDNDKFFSFVEDCRIAGIKVPISAGIMPVLNKAQIERMTGLCGAKLPESFKRILNRYENDSAALFDAGIYYALSQIIDLIATGAEGIHIYTMNRPSVAKRICDGVKNLI